ncbi:amidohydrolase family protein [Puia sp. P3]|uniref:amidohydrolase family protein n=1 Tax=Puia sp. P3 TaxID=3423952 RepID=UPI003D66DCC6
MSIMFRFSMFLLLARVGVVAQEPAFRQPLRSYALTGVTLIGGGGDAPAANQTVVVADGMIADVFPDGSKVLPDSVVLIRLRGKFLLPGLIDTHVHMATDPSGTDNRTATLGVLERMLRSGVTSVRDMAGDARVLAGLSRDARVGDILSPDIYFSALMAGPSFFKDPRTMASSKGGVAGGMPYMKAVADSTDLRQAVAEAKGTGATGIKLYANLGPELVARIVAEARRQGLLVWGHAWLDPARPSDLVRAGVGSISHTPLLVHESRDSMPDLSALFSLMKKNNVLLDATMSAYRQWAQQDSSKIYYYSITKLYTAAAHKAGVKICAGTDDDQTNFVQSEMELLVHDAGFSPKDAMIAATKYAAEALGIGGVCGTIEKGKKADMLVVDRNPLDRIENIRSVVLVTKGGKIYWKED